MNKDRVTGTNPGRLRCGASTMVMGVVLAAMLPSAAWAQEATPPASADTDPQTGQDEGAADAAATTTEASTDDIIVTGVRQALETAQQIKRNADTVVDSITATDIGAFPDKSVAEALQRVAGVTVNRFAATSDTSHFSAEPSGVIVRGLTLVRNEFNGRDTFSANSSRGLGWGDISPELLAGVDTYKNQTAEMIEGGIAGTVNLRTRVPFDAEGQVIQLSANVNYNDLAGNVTPELSGLYSNRWDTAAGELGLLVNYAYSHVETRSQGIQYGRTAIFEDVYGPGRQYIPSSIAYRDNLYDRKRYGLAAAAQWSDPSGRMTATAQYIRSLYKNTWRERGVISYTNDLWTFPVDFVFTPGGPNAQRIPRVADGTDPFTFDEDGNFQSGTIAIQQTDFSWWGANDAESSVIAVNDQGEAMLHPCYSWQAECATDTRGGDLSTVTRLNRNRQFTHDASLNFKMEVTDRLRLNFDWQYVQSEVDNYDAEVGLYTFANLHLDATGELPRMTFLDPTNINQSAGGLINPNNYRYNHAMDHIEDSEGEEWAFRADAEYDFDSDWLQSLKVGYRHADRDQDVRWSTYNWGNIANNWNMGNNQYTYWNIDRHQPSAVTGFNGYPEGLYEVRTFGDDYFGGTNDYVFFTMEALEQGRINDLSFDALGAGQDMWRPICDRPVELADSCFTQSELNSLSETTNAAYAMLRFGGDNAYIGGIRIRGNIGVRYVTTTNVTRGGISFAPQNWPDIDAPPGTDEYAACHPTSPEPGAPTPPTPPTCYASDADRVFNSGGGLPTMAKANHTNWLPSFNLVLGLSDTWQLRFAASRAMARPDLGLLKNYISVSSPTFPDGGDLDDPRYVLDDEGNVIGVNPTYTATGFNPYLKPVTATQFDIAIENYFAEVGSFTLTAFYKNFDDYIQYGSYTTEITNNGVTRTVQVRGPLNGEGAEIYGAEVAYQRFFDFLPSPFDGLGIQANYTYIKNEGIENTNLTNVGGNPGTAQPGTGSTVLVVDALEGLSGHSFNIVGMYEKGPWALRAAYNWRSSYLVTAVDCCVYLPVQQDAAGFLDASIRYALSNNFELSLSAQNLLNTKTVLRQQVTDADEGEILTPNAWFQNDRKFVFGLRFKY